MKRFALAALLLCSLPVWGQYLVPHGPRGGAFTPADIASVVDWATGDDVTVDGEGVNAWTGREGNVVITMNVGVAKPGYSAPDLTFDGGDFLSSSRPGGTFPAAVAQPATWGLRIKFDVSPSTIVWCDNAIGGSERGPVMFATAGGGSLLWGPSLQGGAYTFDTTAYHSYINILDGASSSFRDNGSDVFGAQAQTGGVDGLVIGSNNSGGGPVTGKVRRWALFDSALAGTDLAKFETWLSEPL